MSDPNQFLLYTAPDGAVKIEVALKDETVWLTQKALAELFGVQVPGINKHLKNIFYSGELSRAATVSKMETVRPEGGREVSREVEFYNHHANALIRVTAPAGRLWYLRATARFGWSRNVLLNQIKAGAYERAVTERKTHNFDLALPEHFAEQADEMLKSSSNLEFPGLRRARIERPGGPKEISRGWSAAEPPDKPTHTFKPRQGRQKYPVQPRSARLCRPCRGSHGLLNGFRGFRSFLAPPPANFFGPSRGRSHAGTKANPIGVAACALQSKLPGELKGKLPTAKQLADIVRAEMEGGK